VAGVLVRGQIVRAAGLASTPIVVGIVNNMPGEARRKTEQQFQALLGVAAREQPVELRFLSLDDLPADQLETAAPDGLIVTGMPPQAASLVNEPYWHKLTGLFDFALDHAVPTVCSCLAAHAAVLYLDGIERRRLPQKLSGLVECIRVDSGHPIVNGLPEQWQVPHSRYNELPEAALLAHGYRIFSRSDEAGVDIFAKEFGSLFLFCQGHPEYDSDTLLREYRRDIRQFLACKCGSYPPIPQRCFSDRVMRLLVEFRERALLSRSIDCFSDFPLAACVADLSHSWRDLAVGVYTNWLAHVAECKVRRSGLRWRQPAGGAVDDTAQAFRTAAE
jgi:homoserine O-succinyltransferase